MVHNELRHYGVKGMKWGVRRYQKKDGTLTNAGKNRYNSDKKSKTKDPDEFVKSKGSMAASKLAGGLGEELAAYAAIYAIAYATVYAIGKGVEKAVRASKDKEFEELYENRDPKTLDKLPKLKKKMSPEESMKLTNPDYPDMGSTMNCTFCTTAMALREKGYNVKAAKSGDGWYTDTLFSKTFNATEVKMKKTRTTKDVVDNLNAHGDGAYGNITVSWKYGGAHSIFWKNENGTTNFYDGQSGKSYTKFNDKKTLFDYVDMSSVKYSRLDNCEPTDYALVTVEPIK